MNLTPYFEPATYSGTTYGEGDFFPGDLGPEDVIKHELRRHFKDDEKLAALFKDRFDVMSARPSIDFSTFPRLWITSASNDPSQTPTAIEVDELRVSLIAAFDMQSLVVVAPGYPTVDTVLHHVRRVIREHKTLVTQVNGREVSIASNGRPLGGLLGIEPIIIADRPMVLYEQQAVYQVKVNARSGRIEQLELAGAYPEET